MRFSDTFEHKKAERSTRSLHSSGQLGKQHRGEVHSIFRPEKVSFAHRGLAMLFSYAFHPECDVHGVSMPVAIRVNHGFSTIQTKAKT
jgi:hypothetical protein